MSRVETINLKGLEVEEVPSTQGCVGCYFHSNCFNTQNIMWREERGLFCREEERTDRSHVIFVKKGKGNE